ncbi:MAG: Crp/Fnr family transcriptional regulator [Chloroflexi bacterium]|nr:Crp/Fnr family transcriptional regulator [Chloroflexota bacterium]
MERAHRDLCRKSSSQAVTDRGRLPRVDLAEVLRGLSSTEADAALKLTEDRTYPGGAYIFNSGDEQHGLYLVKNGLVEEFRLTEDGNKLPINRSGPGKFLAVASVEGRYCCFAEALEESVVGFLSFPRLKELCEKFPGAAMNLIGVLVRRVGETEERLQLLALSGLRSRVAGTLLGLHFTQGPRLERVTHEALARWAASSRPKVSVVLEELEKAGLIRLSRGQIEILNAAGLEEWARQAAAAE